jgi:SAM-dependent methyltransferase
MEPSTSDWTAGYVADIGYTYGYYPELNPARIPLAFAHAGLAWPEVGAACELGFGQGMSANIHAAASTVEWHGTDFNPSQAAFAQELASASGNGAQLRDDAFADFCRRPDLPDFDFIGLHGIWSWISDENRAVIVDFVRRKLKVGGVLYISYNTLPGWAAFAPMRHLLNAHADVIGSEGHGIVHRIDGAVDFAQKLLAVNPAYARANPQVTERLKLLASQNRHYLAHEYFNRDWHPMHFGTLSQWLAPAKVSFACSANLLDHVDVVNLTQEQRQFLSGIPDSSFREAVRDFVVNQQFRKDYWVKGPRKLAPADQGSRIRALRFALATPAEDVRLKVTGALGEATLNQEVYGPLLEAMADHRPVSIGELEARVARKNVGMPQLLQAILVLSSAGNITAIQDESTARKAKDRTRRLNAALWAKARFSTDINYLASPLMGGGVGASRIQQIFLSSIASGQKNPEMWAKAAAEMLTSQGQLLLKEGKLLDVAAQSAELLAQAKTFDSKILPVMRALEVI